MWLALAKAVGFYFLQPTFIIGLLVAFIISQRRINRERKAFKTAVYPQRYEVKDYLLHGLLPGLFFSLANVLVGLTLSFEFLLVYQVIALLLLVMGRRFLHPTFAFVLCGSVMIFLRRNPHIDLGDRLASLDFQGQALPALSLWVLVALSSLITVIYLSKKDSLKLSPKMIRAKRGRPGAHYPASFLYVLPLLVLVPGEWKLPFDQWDFWPLLETGSQTYSFIFVPVLFSSLFTITSSKLKDGVRRWRSYYLSLFFLALLGGLLSFFWPDAQLIWLLAYGLIALVLHFYLQIKERQTPPAYMSTHEAVKVVAIRPNTPATRLGIDIGDEILEVNGYPTLTNNDFHRSLAQNRAYIRIKLRKWDGDVIIKEGALYDGEPYNIGVEVVSNDLNAYKTFKTYQK